MPERTKMFRFDVKNVKAAFKDETGVWGLPFYIGYADKIALQPDYNELPIYGDGEIIGILADDKGKTGAISVVAIEDEYEEKCGRKLKIDGGAADVNQLSSIPHCIYYENKKSVNGVVIIEKNWLFNVTSGQAEETYQQTKDDPTINYLEIPLTIMGEVLKDNLGTADYVDANGNTRRATRYKKLPNDTGYDTFGDAVPTPKVSSGV